MKFSPETVKFGVDVVVVLSKSVPSMFRWLFQSFEIIQKDFIVMFSTF